MIIMAENIQIMLLSSARLSANLAERERGETEEVADKRCRFYGLVISLETTIGVLGRRKISRVIKNCLL